MYIEQVSKHHSLQQVNWLDVFSVTDTQTAFSTFHGKYLELYNRHFPKIRAKLRYNNRKPWLSEGIRISIKKKNKLYLKYHRTKTAANEVAYKCYRNKLNQGVFPEELKTANVLPLYKADDPMLFNNYRPVSLLTVLSKVFEKIMYNRLLNFLDTYNILFKNQFGFRKNHSTYMATMLLMEGITKSLENSEYVIGIFLDFSKAFDTVDHDILLRKLYHYGIRGNALQWFESYLKNRKQFVTYNGVSSDTKLITCGVLQGSILGPLLFLIYINDLSLVCDRLISILFAVPRMSTLSKLLLIKSFHWCQNG